MMEFMVKYGGNAHQGYKPDIIMFVEVEFYDVIVGEPVPFEKFLKVLPSNGSHPGCGANQINHSCPANFDND